MNKDNNELNKFLSGEVAYFNELAVTRRSRGIPCEADIKTKTLFYPRELDEEIIDAGLKAILLNPHRDKALDYIFSSPSGNIIDVCCGPGWFCLEGARAGRDMIGYDISDAALELAKKTLSKQKREEKIDGTIRYVNASIETEDLSKLNISSAMGWSAFHHLSNPGAFIDKLYDEMIDDGIIVTMDDLDSDRLSKLFRYFFKFLLPVFEYSYFEKLVLIMQIIIGKRKLNTMLHSPMEIYADKHGAAADIIREKLIHKFSPIYDKEFGAFSIYVCHSLKGPKWWRYFVSKFIVKLDDLLISLCIVSGSYRIIVSKK